MGFCSKLIPKEKTENIRTLRRAEDIILSKTGNMIDGKAQEEATQKNEITVLLRDIYFEIYASCLNKLRIVTLAAKYILRLVL